MTGEVITPENRYNYISETGLQSLPPPPHKDILNDYLLGNFEKDELSIFKLIALFRLKESEEIMELIYGLKYSGVYKIGLELGMLLGKQIKSNRYDYICPVPIHSARKRERGFNQSVSIIKGILKVKEFDLIEDLLVRNKYTQTQTLLDSNQRKENVRKVFSVKKNIDLTNKRILVIDDVLTTGNTLNNCATSLLNNGARRVDAAVVCVSF